MTNFYLCTVEQGKIGSGIIFVSDFHINFLPSYDSQVI